MQKTLCSPWPIIFLITTILVITLGTNFPLNDWRATQWLFNYDQFFTKRGLLGSIYQYICQCSIINKEILGAITKACSVSFSLLFAFFIFKGFRNNKLIAIGLLFAGFGIQQICVEIGRFEHFNYSLVLLACILFKYKENNWCYFLLLSLTPITMLIHEASALITTPLILSVIMLSGHRYKQVLSLLYLIISILCFFMIISFYGVHKTDFPSYFTKISHLATGFNPSLDSATVQSRGVSENILYTLERWQNKSQLGSFSVIMVLSSVPIFIAYKYIHLLIIKKDIYSIFFLALPVISILPLFILGRDFYRWIALMHLNFYLVLAMFLWDKKLIVIINPKLIYFWIILNIYSGGYGASSILPDRWLLFSVFEQSYHKN